MYDLSKRELEICGMVAKGLSNEQIAKLLFLSEGTVKNYISSIYEKTGVGNRVQLAAAYTAKYSQIETDLTDSADGADPYLHISPKLRLVGLPGLPDLIPVKLKGQPFVIGRFDVGVGRKQCDFEFDRSTKAVSRRHAAIEYIADKTAIVDLDSRAGTFVNGNRIAPGKPHPIQHGDHVSFGGMGAEYVFED